MSADWRIHGACGREDPEMFFSEARTSRSIALHVCLTHCPVLEQCATFAAQNPPWSAVQGGVAYGKYGQPLGWEPRAAPTCRRCPQPIGTDTGACGTVRGYGRHTRAGTEVCKPCRVAQTERQRYLASLRPPPPPDPDVPAEIAARRMVLLGDVR
jgi:hypothetical protein